MGDVGKSIRGALVVVPTVSRVDTMAGVQIPESLEGGVIVAEEFDKDL